MRALVISELAAAAGLDVGRVKILRHQEMDKRTGRTSWGLWCEDPRKFELHQSLYDTNTTVASLCEW